MMSLRNRSSKRFRVLPTALVLLFATFLTLPGCWRSNREILQPDDNAHLTFEGRISDALLSVSYEDGRPLYENVELDEDTRYRVEPGVIVVTVVRDGVTTVRRKLFLAAGEVRTIRIP